MSLIDEVNAAIAQRTGQQAAPGVGAPGYPASAGAHLGAPLPNGGHPVTTSAAPPTGFDPSFAFGGPPPPAPAAPPPALAQPTLPAPGQNVFGSASAHNPAWASDGQGGWFELSKLGDMAQLGDARARALYAAPGAPPAPTTFPSHVNPPEAAGAPPAPHPTGSPPPAEVPAVAGKKKGPGRPPKQIQTTIAPPTGPGSGEPRDTTPAPADFSAPAVTLTLNYGGLSITCPAPAELTDTLAAFVMGQVKGS